MLAILHVDQFDFGAGQLDRGRHDVEAGDLRAPHAFAERVQSQEEFIGTG